MNREQYKSTRKKPKRNSEISKYKSRVLAMVKDWKPTTSLKLREAYYTKLEWAINIIPKLEEK